MGTLLLMGTIGLWLNGGTGRTDKDRGSGAEGRDYERPIRNLTSPARPFNPRCGRGSLVCRKESVNCL